MLFLYCFLLTLVFSDPFSLFQLFSCVSLFFAIRTALSRIYNIDVARGTDILVHLDKPENKSHIVAYMLFDGKIDSNFIKTQVQSNLYRYKEYEKLQKTLKSMFLVHYWCPVSNFDFEKHIEVLTKPIESSEELNDFMTYHTSEAPFEPGLPQWKVFILPSIFDGKSAFIMKIHHSLGDGASIMSLIFNLGSCASFESIKLPKFSFFQWLLFMPLGLYHTLNLVGYIIVDYFFHLKKKNDFSGLKLSGKKSGCCSKAIPLQNLKLLSENNPTGFNELVLTLLNKSLQRAHQKKYQKEINELPILMAASLRNYPKPETPLELTNFTNFIRLLEFPKGSFQTILERYKILMKSFKKSCDFYYVQFFSDILLLIVPIWVSEWTMHLFFKAYPFILTSVPGPLKKIRLFDMEVVEMRFLANSPGHIYAVFNVLSYDGKVNFGCFADDASGIESNEIIKGIEELIENEDQKKKI